MIKKFLLILLFALIVCSTIIPRCLAVDNNTYKSISDTEKLKYSINFYNYIRKRILEISGFDDNFLQTHHITYHVKIDSRMNIHDVYCEATTLYALENEYEIYNNTTNFIEQGGCRKINNLIYDQLNLKNFNPNYIFTNYQMINFNISLVPAKFIKQAFSGALLRQLKKYYTAENDYDSIEFEINFSKRINGWGENWYFTSYRTLSSSGNEKFNNLAKIALKRANPILQTVNVLSCRSALGFLDDSVLGDKMQFKILFEGEKIYCIDGKNKYYLINN